jgi:hypothetical protein
MNLRALERLAGWLVFWAMAFITVGYLSQLGQRANGAMRATISINAGGGGMADQLTTETHGDRQVLHMDRPVQPKALAEGWSGPEPGVGTWSVGRRAVLKVAKAADGPLDVKLTLHPFLAAGLPAQRVTVTSQDRTLAQWRLTANQPQELRVAVPAEARAPDGGLVLAFDLPDAETPARRVPGSRDARQIAIKLIRVEVTPAKTE